MGKKQQKRPRASSEDGSDDEPRRDLTTAPKDYARSLKLLDYTPQTINEAFARRYGFRLGSSTLSTIINDDNMRKYKESLECASTPSREIRRNTTQRPTVLHDIENVMRGQCLDDDGHFDPTSVIVTDIQNL